MQATRRLLQHRQPMIKFLGRRSVPKQLDHTPKPHPESPSHDLPTSFANYRQQATQHGPLKSGSPSASSGGPSAAPTNPYGVIGGKSAKELGPIKLGNGEVANRSDLPKRFHRTAWSQAEIEAIESGGASLFT